MFNVVYAGDTDGLDLLLCCLLAETVRELSSGQAVEIPFTRQEALLSNRRRDSTPAKHSAKMTRSIFEWSFA